MQQLFDLLEPDKLPIDFVIVLLVIFAGQFQKRYLFNLAINAAWRTLLVSFVFTFAYGVFMAIGGTFTKDLLTRWFFSYVLATSLYELLLKRVIEKYFPEAADKNNNTTSAPNEN